ncbi:MAG: copper(I)-binding protein CorA [Methylovulum sp.]|uniref:copper(I)-binding protein CorA n=1 Tax=Methylovulum sp. TaxID=1916980 RepID=UPI0026290362|nr:copper(I)-binding protein CorA [Methylovulum sp.]MDD2723732.1 copper(I)-binding protein CorA [Methylovulum sp.]MDD5125349.1 copper(I)-binding protein CorA [Methylovulum sp.]
MKSNFKLLAKLTLLTTAGLFTASSFAATQPAEITNFNARRTHDVFTVKSKGWSDPAFGDMGWTHFSDWGSFTAKRHQKVTIKLVSETVGIHPGVTVWFRGADDTAPDSYVVDHFYPQYANFTKFGAVDETTGESLGNIVMRVVAYGYDQDGNTKVVRRFKGIKDNVPGQLELTFTAPARGQYQFVVGGINPDAGVDNTPKYNIDTTVTKVIAP